MSPARVSGSYGIIFGSEHDAPFVSGVVTVRGFGHRATVDFLLDTGCDQTTLMPRDLDALGIDPEAEFDTKELEESYGIGGGMAVWVRAAILQLRRDDDGWIELKVDEMVIAKPSEHNEDLPSILGRDVLASFHVSLDASKRLVLLER